MMLTIDGLPELSEPKQQEVRQSVLVGLHHAGVDVSEVEVGFLHDVEDL